jgi:hypothetical protein|tara:strand:+ start:125 stop:586 length:462 start_codon:yes stop_codon:yes gene_type:complete
MKNNKPKQLEFNFNKTFAEASNKYDDTNYIYNAADNGIYTEQELKKKFSAQDNYKLLKSVANQQEKKEFRDIERKYKKIKPIAQRRVPLVKKDDTSAPLKIDITPLPQINPFQDGLHEKIKEFYTWDRIGRKDKLAKVKGGLVNILGVQDVKK